MTCRMPLLTAFLRATLLALVFALIVRSALAAQDSAPQVRIPTADPNVDQICEVMPGALGTPLCSRRIDKTTGLVTSTAPVATSVMPLAVSPLGNETGLSAVRATHAGTSIRATTVDGTSRNFMRDSGIHCTRGGGTLSPRVADQTDNDDACVNEYVSTVMDAGAGNSWIANWLLSAQRGVQSVNVRGLELDLNIENMDHDPGREEPGPASPPAAWIASTAVNTGKNVHTGKGVYVAYNGGVTGTTAPTCTTESCSDGGVTWTYMGAYPSAASSIGLGITGYGGGCLKTSGGTCVRDARGLPEYTAYAASAGILFAAINGPIAHRGIVYETDAVDGCDLCDYGSGANTGIYIKGAHPFGIDLGYMAGVPLRIGNASPIQGFRHGTSTAIDLMALDTGDNLTLGAKAASIQPQASIIPDGDTTRDLGNSTRRFGTIWAGNAQISNIKAVGPVHLPAYTVATLPACMPAFANAMASVTDAASPAYNQPVTGGGTKKVPVFCDGAGPWTAH